MISKFLVSLFRALKSGVRAYVEPPSGGRNPPPIVRAPRATVTVARTEGPSPQAAGKQSRLRDACDLVLAGTDIPQAIRCKIAVRLERGDRISNLLKSTDWSWPWFDDYLVLFKSMGTWPDRWSYVERKAGPVVRPDKPEAATEMCVVDELKQVAQLAGVSSPSKSMRRTDWEALVISRCSMEQILAVLEPRFQQEDRSRLEAFLWAKASLLGDTIDRLAQSLTVLDKAKELQAQSSRGGGRGVKVKLVAESHWEHRRVFQRLALRFNRGDLTTLPPYFPGHSTHVDWQFSDSKRPGRMLDEIPAFEPWKELTIDFGVEPPKVETNESAEERPRELSPQQKDRAQRNRAVLQRAILGSQPVAFTSRQIEHVGLPIEIRNDEITLVDFMGAEPGEKRSYKLHAIESPHSVAHGLPGYTMKLIMLAVERKLPLDLQVVNAKGRVGTKVGVLALGVDANCLMVLFSEDAEPKEVPLARVLDCQPSERLQEWPEAKRRMAILDMAASNDASLQHIALDLAAGLSPDSALEVFELQSREGMDETRRVIADTMRAYTKRIRKTVMGQSVTLLDHEQDPRVFSILQQLASDKDRETVLKAAYALGDHPSDASRAILKGLLRKYRGAIWIAARHALDRLDQFAAEEVKLRRLLAQKEAERKSKA